MSKAAPPISPIDPSPSAGWRLRPEEEVGEHLPLPPEGFISLALAIHTLARHATVWGLIEREIGREADVGKRIAKALVNGRIIAVGIDPHTGDMKWIPLATWRKMVWVSGGRPVAAPDAALMRPANPVPVSIPQGRSGNLSLEFRYYPYVRLDQLAALFGAIPPPEGPTAALLASIGTMPAPHVAPPTARAAAPPLSTPSPSPDAPPDESGKKTHVIIDPRAPTEVLRNKPGRKPPFDIENAHRRLVTAKAGKLFKTNPPIRSEIKEYLKPHYSGLPNDALTKAIHAAFGEIPKGRRKAAK